MARLSLCVGLLAVLLVLASASVARADLLSPVLTGTDPASPGDSLTPRIHGEISEEEEGETKVVLGVGLRASGPISRASGDPDNIVRIYTDATTCTAFAGEGTVEELEGSGIQIIPGAVAEDAVTTFYARQFDPGEGGESPCSTGGLRYRQVTAPPGVPVLESVSPASPANENFPHLIGSADLEATVSIYPSAGCTGTAVGSGSGAQFGSGGIQAPVPDNSETTFSARATITVNFAGGATGDFVSGCSTAPLVYQEVTPPSDPGVGGGGGTGGGGGGGVTPATPVKPPAPHLRTIPGGWANDNTPLVTGNAPGASTVRIYADPNCSGSPVAKGSVAEFDAGLPVRVVDNQVTVFSGVSVAGGKASDCSDPVVYVEDSLTPRTRITMGPASKTAKRKAIIRFTDTTGNAPGTAFLCRVDKRKWRQCASPLRLRKLRPKRYVVQVKATDPAGNVETRAAKRRFRVVAHP